MACVFNQCIYKFADNPQQLNVLRSAAGFWMDGLVNYFPIDIVWKGKGGQKTIFFFFFFFSIWHMVTKCTEFIFIDRNCYKFLKTKSVNKVS